MKSFVFPGNIEQDILAIAAQQVPYMRTQWFSDLVIESESMLLELIDCPNGRVIPYTASGTAAMESCVTEFVGRCRKALVLNGGTFGARWGELCHYHDISYDEFRVEFGKAPDWDSFEKTVACGGYDVLLMQHHETSSGYLFDLEKISGFCRANGIYLVVDAISSFLADFFSMTEHCVDIALISSQKGLNLPPGLSYVILSEKIVNNNNFGGESYYLDWENNLLNLQRGQTPFSPATHLFMQACERLRRIKVVGVERTIEAVRQKAVAFRDACRACGWSLSADQMSNCLTGVYFPFPVRPLVEYLMKKRIYVMPCGRDNMIRVAHLGASTIADHEDLIEEIVKWQRTASE